VAGEEGGRPHPGAGVVARAAGHRAAAEVATTSREALSCQGGVVLKASTGVLSYPLAFASPVLFYGASGSFQMLLLLPAAVLCLCDSLEQVFVARSWFCS
jgi:hypothetical protein